ncbi:MAG: hypothetical protein ACLUVC_10910 [Longibaculum sp.]
MIDKIKVQMYLFKNNKMLMGLYLLICILPSFGIFYFTLKGAEGLFIFQVLSRFLFYINLIFVIITYLFLTMDRRNKLAETIKTINKFEYRNLSIIVISILFILYNFIILLSLLFVGVYTNHLGMMMELLSRYYFMNILMPQICCLIITILISQISNLNISLIVFVIMIFMTSPYMESFVSMQKPAIPIDFIGLLRKPFSFFYQNGEMSIDVLYGFQNEKYKLFTFLFWSCCFLIYMIWPRVSTKKRIIKISSSTVILSCSLAMIYIPESQYRVDENWNRTYADMNYYEILDHQNNYQKEEKLDYRVECYKLNIQIRRQLNVSGNIEIKSNKPRKAYSLTLYHDYKIKDISCNKEMTYRQEGDYINIEFVKPTQEFDLKISYSGYHPNLYSNNQAVQLPGYFAWYPMAGQKQIFVTMDDSFIAMYGFNPYNRSENASFDISIDAPYPIITNIEQIDDHHYVGTHDGLFLIGGYVEKVEKGNLLNFFPLYNFDYSTNDYFNDIELSLKDIDNQMKMLFGVETSLVNKKILVGSNGLVQTINLGGYSEFDNCTFIANNGYLSITDYIGYHLFNKTNIDPVLRDIVIMSIDVHQSQEEFLQKMQEQLDQRIEVMNYDDENIIKEREKYIAFKKQMLKDMEKLGQEKYMEKISQELKLR